MRALQVATIRLRTILAELEFRIDARDLDFDSDDPAQHSRDVALRQPVHRPRAVAARGSPSPAIAHGAGGLFSTVEAPLASLRNNGRGVPMHSMILLEKRNVAKSLLLLKPNSPSVRGVVVVRAMM